MGFYFLSTRFTIVANNTIVTRNEMGVNMITSVEFFNGTQIALDTVSAELIKSRTIYLFEEITSRLALEVITQIHGLLRTDRKAPITIYINSPGGNVFDGLAIYDTIRLLPCTVTTIGMGAVSSMASLILAAGTRGFRFVSESCQILLHQPSATLEHSKVTDLDLAVKQHMKTKKRLTKILSELTGKSQNEISALIEQDYYLDAEAAIRLGLVDHVLKGPDMEI